MLYKEEVRMIMIIETVLVSVASSTFIFGMTGFSVFINKMEEADNIKQESKACIYYAESVKRFCNSV